MIAQLAQEHILDEPIPGFVSGNRFFHLPAVSSERISDHLGVACEAEPAAKGLAEFPGIIPRKTQLLQLLVELLVRKRPVHRKRVDLLLMAFLHFCVCVHRSMASFAFSLTVIGVVW